MWQSVLITGCKYWSLGKLNATLSSEKSRDQNDLIKNYHTMRTFREKANRYKSQELFCIKGQMAPDRVGQNCIPKKTEFQLRFCLLCLALCFHFTSFYLAPQWISPHSKLTSDTKQAKTEGLLILRVCGSLVGYCAPVFSHEWFKVAKAKKCKNIGQAGIHAGLLNYSFVFLFYICFLFFSAL